MASRANDSCKINWWNWCPPAPNLQERFTYRNPELISSIPPIINELTSSGATTWVMPYWSRKVRNRPTRWYWTRPQSSTSIPIWHSLRSPHDTRFTTLFGPSSKNKSKLFKSHSIIKSQQWYQLCWQLTAAQRKRYMLFSMPYILICCLRHRYYKIKHQYEAHNQTISQKRMRTLSCITSLCRQQNTRNATCCSVCHISLFAVWDKNMIK